MNCFQPIRLPAFIVLAQNNACCYQISSIIPSVEQRWGWTCVHQPEEEGGGGGEGPHQIFKSDERFFRLALFLHPFFVMDSPPRLFVPFAN